MTMVASTYALAYIADRWCSSPYPTERIYSPVSNRAGLCGMGHDERFEVLEQLFSGKKTIQKYDKATIKKMPMEIEMTDLKPRLTKATNGNNSQEGQGEPTEDETESGVGLEGGCSGDAEAPALHQTSHTSLQSQELGLEQANNNLCSICLTEFGTSLPGALVQHGLGLTRTRFTLTRAEKGDKVMTGTQCTHLYHFTCIMEWMQKGHDHCPFCRVVMFSPQEMRTVALQVLGPKRVQQLARPDEEIQLETTGRDAPNNDQVSPRATMTQIEPDVEVASNIRQGVSGLPGAVVTQREPDTQVQNMEAGQESTALARVPEEAVESGSLDELDARPETSCEPYHTEDAKSVGAVNEPMATKPSVSESDRERNNKTEQEEDFNC